MHSPICRSTVCRPPNLSPHIHTTWEGSLRGSLYRVLLEVVPQVCQIFPAVAYHFCLAMPASFTRPGVRLLAKTCTHDLRGTDAFKSFEFGATVSLRNDCEHHHHLPLRGITPLSRDWPPSLLGVNPAGGWVPFRKEGCKCSQCQMLRAYVLNSKS